MKRLFIIALALFVTTTSVVHAANDRLFDGLAKDIVSGLSNASLESLPANSGYGPPRIAVRTLNRDNEAVSDKTAAAYTRRMLTALQAQAKGQFRFVALDALDNLILNIKAESLSAEEQSARIADLRANARADVLVAGFVRNDDGDTSIAYQAINTDTGELLASSTIKTVQPKMVFAPPVRPKGRYRPNVEDAEQILADKGYDPGPIDGYMTPETRDALRAYQLDSALPVNGRLTRRVVKNLRRDTRADIF